MKTLKTLAKKITLLFLSLFMACQIAGQTAFVVYAINMDELLPTNTFSVGVDKENKDNKDTIKESSQTQLQAYNNLPDVSFQSVVTNAIKLMLYLAGSLFVLGVVITGVMYLAGSLNEEFTNKAKKTLGYLGLGIIIMSASYALVTGILQINLFD